MHTLIAFATEWGSKHGGINSFNADFLKQFGAAYHHSAQIICVVTEHTSEAANEAANSHVRLLALPYAPNDRSFDASIGELSIDLLRKADITLEPAKTIWLGHDLITGEAAIAAAKLAGGRSAVIHHMSYDDYESYAKDTDSARKKTEKQTAILKETNLLLAIGPLLRDAASDRVGASKAVHMLVPGLPEIETKEAPKRFVAFVSGRLSADAARIKQGHLGVAAFAAAELKARNEGVPEPLIRQPKLLLRGVDFENRKSDLEFDGAHDPETKLQNFADEYAKGVVNIHALPYTEDRQELYAELSGSSVALMPSWHEGFGLVAWEAIAAGVPLIVGENTGVYRLLDDEYSGAQTGYVYPVYVSAKRESPYFQPEDLEKTINALRSVALDPAKARTRAGKLRNELLEKYTWPNCCEQAATVFDWDLQRGSVSDRTQEIIQEATKHATATSLVSLEAGPLKIPRGQWRPGAGMADSQLLRAEEELLPFDSRRRPDVEKLRQWISDADLLLTVRLITGDGGQGKTRLAIHVCQQLRAEGWHSGFLDSSLKVSEMPWLWRELKKLNQPAFIVVDYAETRQEAFLGLLKAGVEDPPDKPVRMLLLARNGGEWWDNLPSINSSCEALLNGPATSGPFVLPPLYEEQQDRQQAFRNALRAFANILQVESPQIVPELVGDQFQRPLFVQMAALLALYGERPTTIQGLTKALLNHERRYWVGLLSPTNLQDPGRRAEQLLALATLAGGFQTARLAETVWTAAKGNALTKTEFTSMYRSLAALYPGAEGLQGLRPDLLGEALVAQALLRVDGDELLDAVLSSSAAQSIRRNALTVLARMSTERADAHEIIVTVLSRRLQNCAADLVAISTETASRLPELSEMAFQRLVPAIKNQVAGLLQQALPRESVQLAGVSCVVFGHLTERSREKLRQKPNHADRLYDFAWTLDRYASALSHVGRFKEALETSHTALATMRTLMSRDRAAYEARYSRYLFNYASHLSHFGEDKEVLACARESLEIRERLVKKDPSRFESTYAQSLDQYGSSLGNLARYKEAVEQGKQAVAIYARLVQVKPDQFEPDYADALSNYAVHLSDAGEMEKALAHTREALDIRERLMKKNPDRFEPDYAISLRNYASCLGDLGMLTKAFIYAREAYVASARLAAKHPQRFGADLFYDICAVRFLSWLCHQELDTGQYQLEKLIAAALQNEQNRLRILAAFTDACLNNIDRTTRAGSFQFVLDTWFTLSPAQKTLVAAYRFCAAAWCAKYNDLLNTNWHGDWQAYVETRRGNIPFWISEVARRLDFEFPQVNTAAD